MQMITFVVLIKVKGETNPITTYTPAASEREKAKKKRRLKTLSAKYDIDQPEKTEHIGSFLESHSDRWCSARFGGGDRWFDGVLQKELKKKMVNTIVVYLHYNMKK